MSREGEALVEPEPDALRAAQRGDDEAFEGLVRLYLGDVYRLALHLVRDHDLAQDVSQDTFLNAYRGLPSFRWRSKFSTWLFSIARNCSMDALRRVSKQRDAWREVEREEIPDYALRTALRAALAALPTDLREAFVVIEIFGFSYPEAARILRTPVGTLKSRMHRTRKLLIAALDEEESTGEV